MKGRPVRGLFAGLLLGVCLDLDLAFGGAVRLDSAVLTIVPAGLLVLGLLLGSWAPIGRSMSPLPHLASPLPPPVAWPDSAPTEGSTIPAPTTWNAPPVPKRTAAEDPPPGGPPASPPPTPI